MAQSAENRWKIAWRFFFNVAIAPVIGFAALALIFYVISLTR